MPRATLAVIGGTVYVGSWDGYEYALDEATGVQKWRTYLGITQVSTCTPPSAGISSGAAVQNGVVYVGGGDSYRYALDATTGAVLWKVFTGDNSAGGVWASPTVDTAINTVYVTTGTLVLTSQIYAQPW